MNNQFSQIAEIFEDHVINQTNSDGSRFIVECHDSIKETEWGIRFYLNTNNDYYEIQECTIDGNEYFGTAEEFYSFEDLMDYLNETY